VLKKAIILLIPQKSVPDLWERLGKDEVNYSWGCLKSIGQHFQYFKEL